MSEQQAFQKCPLCDGTGNRVNKTYFTCYPFLDIAINIPPLQSYTDKDGKVRIGPQDNICPVCRGKRIISTVTGKPPID